MDYKHKNTWLQISAICVIAIVICPIICATIWTIADKKCDIILKGYTNKVPEPQLSGNNLYTGKFQHDYEAWLDANLQPKGLFTKIYNSIRYHAFDIASGRLDKGADNYLFEKMVPQASLGVGGFNYASAKKRAEMDSFVKELVQLKSKLAIYGKWLYVYVPGSKAEAYPDFVPKKYVDIQAPNHVSAVDCFREEIEKTEIAHFFAKDILSDLKYPSFYKSGTHWSRTYQQTATNRVISDLCKLTGRRYRQILYKNVESSKYPFGDDADILDLCNIWGGDNETYYQFIPSREIPEDYDKLRVILQGDSFGGGTRKDILDTYPHETFFYVNRCNYVMDNYGNLTRLKELWENMDWQYYLDRVDIVIIECVPYGLHNYSHGFVQYLNKWLDNYVPGLTVDKNDYMVNFDASKINGKSDSLKGIMTAQGSSAWANRYNEIILHNPELRNGLEIRFLFPKILDEFRNKTILIYVNGHRLTSYVPSSGKNTILISGDEIPEAEDGVYDIELYCAAYFVPSERGISPDTRELAIQLQYVGEVR